MVIGDDPRDGGGTFDASDHRALAMRIRQALIYLRNEAASTPELAPLRETLDAAVNLAAEIAERAPDQDA